MQDVGHTPAEMIFGTNLSLPGEMLNDVRASNSSNEWIDEFCEDPKLI